jgi:hypothetical protein
MDTPGEEKPDQPRPADDALLLVPLRCLILRLGGREGRRIYQGTRRVLANSDVGHHGLSADHEKGPFPSDRFEFSIPLEQTIGHGSARRTIVKIPNPPTC